MINKQLRDNLKTLSKIEQQLHMYTPDQLRNALRIAITCAREATKEQIQSIEGNRIARPENEAVEAERASLCAYAEKLESLIKEQDAEIAQLLGALLCKEPGCNGEGVIRYVENGWRHMIKSCPTCGPIRKALKEDS